MSTLIYNVMLHVGIKGPTTATPKPPADSCHRRRNTSTTRNRPPPIPETDITAVTTNNLAAQIVTSTNCVLASLIRRGIATA